MPARQHTTVATLEKVVSHSASAALFAMSVVSASRTPRATVSSAAKKLRRLRTGGYRSGRSLWHCGHTPMQPSEITLVGLLELGSAWIVVERLRSSDPSRSRELAAAWGICVSNDGQ